VRSVQTTRSTARSTLGGSQGSYADGALIPSGHSARSLVGRLAGDDSGKIWDVTDDV
jgi:hypothetical protein